MAPENGKAVSALERGTAEKACATTQAATSLSFPPAHTVKGRILADLLVGRRITPARAWVEHGSSRLAAVVHVLKRDGWPVLAGSVEVQTADGRTAHVAQYHLSEASIVFAGEAGARFVAAVREGGHV
jgi:hypothetical protein